jgi:3-oxoacid CoA-transferase
MIFKHISLHRFSSLNKIYPSSAAALHDLKSGSKILFGGFGICGIPENLIKYIHSSDIKDIWAISNTAGIQTFGLGTLLTAGKLKRFTASYVGENPEFERQYLKGEIAVEFCPQGTLAERCRSAAMGIPAFFTRPGLGTYVETGGFPVKFAKDGKEVEEYSKPKEVIKIIINFFFFLPLYLYTVYRLVF